MVMTNRKQRGMQIAKLDNQITRKVTNTYEVKSQSGNGKYEVVKTPSGWKCSCPDHIFRGVKCKHIWSVEFSLAFKKEVKVRRIEPITTISNCVFCDSTNIVRDGVRHNKDGDIQKFYAEIVASISLLILVLNV